jgi:hypothetical protein
VGIVRLVSQQRARSPEEMARCLDLVSDQSLLEECLYNRFNARIEHAQRPQRSTAFVYPHSDTGPSGPLRKRVPKQPTRYDPSAPLSQKKKRPQEKKHPQAPPKENEENNPSKKATSAKKRKTNSKQRRAKKPKPPATASAVSSDGEDTTTTTDSEPPKRGRRKATGAPRSDDLSSLELLRLRHDISTLRDRFDGFKYAAPEIVPATSRVEQLIALREEMKVLQSIYALQGGVSAMELLQLVLPGAPPQSTPRPVPPLPPRRHRGWACCPFCSASLAGIDTSLARFCPACAHPFNAAQPH